MTTRIKTFSLPHRPRRRRSTQSAPKAAPHSATSSTIVPQLVPLLDLLADLIANDLVRERNGADGGLGREVSEAHAVTATHDDSTVVQKHGKRRSVSQFPSKVPPRVPPKSH